MKPKTWTPLKEMLFSYLAVTKILYWLNTVTALNQAGFGVVTQAVAGRLLSQDVLIIASILIFAFLDKRISSKKSRHSSILGHVIFYAVGYAAVFGFAAGYALLMSRVFEGMAIDSWAAFFAYGTFGYLVIVIVLNIKYHFKAKSKAANIPKDEKLAALNILLDGGILTQEEFASKTSALQD